MRLNQRACLICARIHCRTCSLKDCFFRMPGSKLAVVFRIRCRIWNQPDCRSGIQGNAWCHLPKKLDANSMRLGSEHQRRPNFVTNFSIGFKEGQLFCSAAIWISHGKKSLVPLSGKVPILPLDGNDPLHLVNHGPVRNRVIGAASRRIPL